MEVDETNWQYSPEFVLDEIFGRLALADLRTASCVCLNWRKRASLAANRWDRLSLTATHFQWEPVRYICTSIFPGMSPRTHHASCYHPKSGKVYVFGGEVPTTGIPTPQLNDLWSFDLARRCWERVVVRSTSYPMPKSNCSLAAWEDFLVLVGGSRYDNGPNEHRRGRIRTCTREIHRFDTRKMEWIERYDQYTSPLRHLVHVVDLKLGIWHEPSFPFGPHEKWTEGFFPDLLPACTSVLLRPGCILVHPSASFFDHSRDEYEWVAYLLHFDPNDPTQDWGSERIAIGGDQIKDRRWGFANIGVTQVNNKTRLIHLASAERQRVAKSSQMVRRMETFHATVRTALRDHIMSPEDIARFYNSLYTEPFSIKYEGSEYILSPGNSGTPSDVRVTVESLHPTGPHLSPAEVDINISFIQCSFLPADLRSEGWSVCEQTIRRLSSSDNEEMILISADLDRVEEEKEIRWTLCEMRGEAPPVTSNYSFVSAGGQMVMHGGSFTRGCISSGGACSGGTYILDPVPS